ncbi:hypothetical protein AOL_s00097g377 [Orbilia oligospora ATCC 24927]|uniref:Uncharacterized protein n=2 Tax=Orbilia oligospora TaxID=2813651 RepID=G1XJ50_ARTOA|nr:hypothetical protein AOL_s00097g377 [Orbilia oligospora ATCC 24927]EGX46951.1 hypothetical protein AOL_s00097g377 [Orbilia oligospora ATCC 24927]KAF3274913.1 hypothetical protein TWF970_007616 [Orbilia oligospora]
MEKCPNELIGLFLEDSSLNNEDLANCALVSRRFRIIADRVLYRTLPIAIDIDPIPYLDDDMEPTAPDSSTVTKFRKMIQVFKKKGSYVRNLSYNHTSAQALDLGSDENLFKDHFVFFNRIQRLALYTFGDGAQYFSWFEILKGISGILVSNPNLKELVVVHKPSAEELSQEMDLDCIHEILRQGTVVQLTLLTVQFILKGWAHEARGDSWNLTDSFMTMLDGCTDDIMHFLFDYVVPPDGTQAGEQTGTRRRLWSLPSLKNLGINFVGKEVAPLSDILDLETLGSVEAFHFLSPLRQDLEELADNLSSLVQVKEMHIHVLNINNWVPPFLLSGEAMPSYNREGCRMVTELLIMALKELNSVTYAVELPAREGVLLLAYLVERVPKQVFESFELPAYALAVDFWGWTTDDIGYLGIGHHIP